MNTFELSRKWFDFCLENPEKVNTNQTALYFYCIDLCNRLSWANKFGLPTAITMQYAGIKSYKTYAKALQDLIDFGFIKLVQKSKNQHSANVVALVKFTKASSKQRHKRVESNDISECGIIKPLKPLKTLKPLKQAAPFDIDSFDFNFSTSEIAENYKNQIEYSKNPFDYCAAALIKNRLFKDSKDKVSKQAYKGLVSKIKELSQNDILKANKITQTAIESNWKTFYPLKENTKETETAKPKLNL